MTYRLAIVLAVVVWPSLVEAQIETNSSFNISGQIISATSGQYIPFSNIMYGRTSGTRADSLSRFEIRNIKPGQYKLHFSAQCYPDKDTIISVVNKDITKMNWMIPVVCSKVGYDSALVDINTNQLKLFLQSGDPPVSYLTDKRFSKKYKVSFYEFGDLIIHPCDCLIEYNRVIFEYLDQKYGSRWRTNFRPNVPGYKY